MTRRHRGAVVVLRVAVLSALAACVAGAPAEHATDVALVLSVIAGGRRS